jgi:hypothetical protein
MGGFGEDAQAAGHEADHNLNARQSNGGDHRTKRG